MGDEVPAGHADARAGRRRSRRGARARARERPHADRRGAARAGRRGALPRAGGRAGRTPRSTSQDGTRAVDPGCRPPISGESPVDVCSADLAMAAITSAVWIGSSAGSVADEPGGVMPQSTGDEPDSQTPLGRARAVERVRAAARRAPRSARPADPRAAAARAAARGRARAARGALERERPAVRRAGAPPGRPLARCPARHPRAVVRLHRPIGALRRPGPRPSARSDRRPVAVGAPYALIGLPLAFAA